MKVRFERVLKISTLSLLLVLVATVGCSPPSDSGSGSGNTTDSASAAPIDGEQVTVAISGMTWAVGWEPKAIKALAAVPGVRNVKLDFAAKTAVLTFDEGKRNDEAVLAALKNVNFGGEIKK